MRMLKGIKEYLFLRKKRLKQSLFKLIRNIKRSLLKKQMINSENCFNVPIIINNRNRYTFLKLMIEQLTSFGYKHIYILDNDSTYPPLLEYYKTIVEQSYSSGVETDIVHQGAFTFPAVALTLTNENWDLIKDLHKKFAEDLQVDFSFYFILENLFFNI